MARRSAVQKLALADPRVQIAVVREHADEILKAMRSSGKMLLSDMFAGDSFAAARDAVIQNQYFDRNKKRIHVSTRPIPGTNEHEILAVAAVARDPGRADDFLDTIKDFVPSGKAQAQLVLMYWNIYENEGIINNATNKIAAILSGGGRFKIRHAKKGKARKAKDELEELLYFWTQKVNASADDAVITGSRGLQAVIHQGVRTALVEGSWIGRTVWDTVDVPSLGKAYDLPVNIQTLSTQYILPVLGLVGTGIERFYWKPSRQLINQITSPADGDVKKLMKKFIPSDQANKLIKDGQVVLDPALLLHVKNRGSDRKAFGESFINAAFPAIAYSRSIDQLDIVSMENLINRLTIVMVGSADPASPYSKTDVSQARTALMQTLFDTPGPNMTIVWSGNDVAVKDVGAHASVLSLDNRHKIAQDKIKISLGVPDALLSGTSADGKAAGWAAILGSGAQLEELENSFGQVVTTLGERIATQNNFTEIDVTYEFDHGLLLDRTDEAVQTRSDYLAGAMSIRSLLLSRGRDPDAEFRQRAFEQGLNPDDQTVTWQQVFAPPQGLPGQGAGSPQGQGPGKVPGDGRAPTDTTTPPTTPPATPTTTPTKTKNTPNTNK